MLKTLVSACVFAMVATTGLANAQPSDNRTLFTFNQPVALPGVTLPAGTYQFRLVDELSRKVVQVLDAGGTTSYGIFLTTPAVRNDVSGDATLQFMETREGMPVAIRSWWSPLTSVGYEFVYPQSQTRFASSGARTRADRS